MRTIPSAVQTLLKSRSMIGANKPSHEVTVEGLSGGWDLEDPSTVVYNPTGNTAARHLSATVLADGRVLCVWTDTPSASCDIKQGYAASVEAFFADSCLTDITTIFAATDQGRATVFEHDGEYYLHTVWHQLNADARAKCQMWKLVEGAWSLHGVLRDVGGVGGGFKQYMFAGIPYIQEDRWVVMSVDWYYNSDVWFRRFGIYVSIDKGVTWTKTLEIGQGILGGAYSYFASRNIAEMNGILYIANYTTYGSVQNPIRKSSDYGDTWNIAYTTFSPSQINLINYNNKLHAIAAGTSLTLYSADDPDIDTWVDTGIDWAIAAGDQILLQLTDSQAALFSSYGLIGIKMKSASIPVKSITVSRNKNTAGQLTLVVDNKGGEWAPDGTAHLGILWPNTQIGLWQGYGAELVKTFTGTIDSVALSTFPQDLTLNLRDHLKYALDQIITSGSSHVLTYTAQTIEAIVTDLISKASMTVGTIHATGITIATKTFSWCTYADAIQELAELAGGWEYGCDEDGLFYFRKDSNVSPLAKGWTLTFASGAAQTLYYPIITDSERIYSGATVYVKDTDYSIDYDTGAITSITIADGSVTMDYAYISYEFAEGEDIISLGYTLDDEAAYYKVAVYGQAADGHVVFASADFASRTYYNVLPQKFMKIDAGESAQTVAECQVLADQAIRLMESRIRICTFAAVAVPWLQCGDFIRVTETSTTISEIYRITDLSTSMDDSGYTMQITCFHHSA